MSSNMEKLLKPFPSDKNLVDAAGNDNISFKNHTCITREATTMSPDLDSEEDAFFDCQTGLASDSEDDFRSVNGIDLMSPSPNKTPPTNEAFDSKLISSHVEEEIERTEILKEPFWSDQVVSVDRHDQVLTVNKEIKLAQFLQDSSWIRQVVANDNHRLSWTRSVARFKSKNTNAKHNVYRENSKGGAEGNMAKATDCYSWLSFRKSERQNPIL